MAKEYTRETFITGILKKARRTLLEVDFSVVPEFTEAGTGTDYDITITDDPTVAVPRAVHMITKKTSPTSGDLVQIAFYARTMELNKITLIVFWDLPYVGLGAYTHFRIDYWDGTYRGNVFLRHHDTNETWEVYGPAGSWVTVATNFPPPGGLDKFELTVDIQEREITLAKSGRIEICRNQKYYTTPSTEGSACTIEIRREAASAERAELRIAYIALLEE